MRNVAEVVAHEFAVFLEGVRIPVLGFDVNFSMETSFNINVPPVSEFNDLKPNTHALIVYRENKASSTWHLLAEGVYMGPSYNKTPLSRTMRLRFRDVQWFLETARVYDLVIPGSFAPSESFALAEAAFLGDSRYHDASVSEKDVEGSTQLSARFNFLNSLQRAGKDESLSPLTKPFEALWALLSRTNEFFRVHTKALRLNEDRVHIIDNRRMGEIFKGNLLYESFTKMFGEFTTQTNVMDIMLMLMQIIQYDMFPIPGMASSGGSSIRSYVTKPVMHLVAPPACNVVFPDEVSVFNYEIHYSNRPTRLWYRDVLDSFGTTLGFFAPPEIGEVIDAVSRGEPGTHLTEEERFRGVNPQIVKLPWAYTRGISTPLDEEQYQETLSDRSAFNAAFTSYLYHEQKYASTPMNLQTRFNPRFLPGFPMLILDPIMPMIGSVIAVGHYIDIESGTAYTGVTLSHVRPANQKTPTLAGWYDQREFSPENIGGVYGRFGTKVFFDAEGVAVPFVDDDGMVDFYPAVKAVRERYEKTKGISKFLYGRDLPSFWDEKEGRGDISDALNITWQGDELAPKSAGSDNSPFSIDYEGVYGTPSVTEMRRQVVRGIKSKLFKGGAGVWKRSVEEGGVM